MTRTGVGFIIAGLIVYLVASQSQVGWLYLFDAILWSLFIVSAVLAHHDLRSLKVEQQVILPTPAFGRQLPGGPVEDEVVEVRLKVSNGGRFSRHFIGVLADFPFEAPGSTAREFLLTTVKPGAPAEFTSPVTCYRRGRYPDSEIVLKSGGPLGLFSRRRVFRLPLNLTVYPGYYRMEETNTPGEEWTDWGQGNRSAAASQFYGSREYQYGDPLKHVHWRNTARLGRFMIKEFEQSSRGPIAVAFGTGKDYGEGRETTLEYSVRIAASLARLCADSGRGIDILAGEKTINNAGWQEAMDFLAGIGAREDSVPEESLAPPAPGQTVVVIVPSADAGAGSGLLRLAAQAGNFMVMLEGFAEDDEKGKALSGIPAGGVLHCSPGNLEETINRLASYLSSADRPAAGAGWK
jgi:uncharacterized protein (DUF58 family)